MKKESIAALAALEFPYPQGCYTKYQKKAVDKLRKIWINGFECCLDNKLYDVYDRFASTNTEDFFKDPYYIRGFDDGFEYCKRNPPS